MWFPNRSDTNQVVQSQKMAKEVTPKFSPRQIVGFPMWRLNYAAFYMDYELFQALKDASKIFRK